MKPVIFNVKCFGKEMPRSGNIVVIKSSQRLAKTCFVVLDAIAKERIELAGKKLAFVTVATEDKKYLEHAMFLAYEDINRGYKDGIPNNN
jgi:hypothetical protein